jgi:hypothetical protein
VFAGDMDASALPNLVQLAKDANLLIFHCAVLDPPGSPSQLSDLHTPPKRIGEAARESGVKNLLLSHPVRMSWGKRPRCGSRFALLMQGRLRLRATTCASPSGNEQECRRAKRVFKTMSD